MTVTVFWPEERIPLPLKQGYVLEPKPNVIRTEVEVGPDRARRRSTQTPTEVTVVWELTQWQLMLFQGFYKHQAMEGAAWFGIPLLTTLGVATCEAQFKGKLSAPKQRGDLWLINATLVVREIPELDALGYEILLTEEPAVLYGAIDGLGAALTGLPALPYYWNWS